MKPVQIKEKHGNISSLHPYVQVSSTKNLKEKPDSVL